MTEVSAHSSELRTEPRDASWVSAMPLVAGGLVVFAALKLVGVIPGSGGMPAGTYQCLTATSVAPIGRQQPRSREELREETGQDMVGDIIVPGAMVIPAPFGNIEMDASGNYRMVNNGANGSFSVDASTGALSFTGEMAVLSVTGTDAEAGRFLASYEEMRFDCNLLGQ